MASEPDHLRLFIAIHVPEVIREGLRDAQRRLEKGMPKDSVRWTVFEQLHLTLEFLGSVTGAETPQVEQALTKAAASHASFRLTAESVGAFSSIRNPRVIWAGVAGDIDRLQALQSDVRARVIQWEKEPESRPYRPHLTLGRGRPLKARELHKVSKALAAFAPRPFGEWRVDDFALVQSKLLPHGAQHSVLASFPLQRPNGNSRKA